MESAPPSIPSPEGYVDFMAGHRANRTAAVNQTEHAHATPTSTVGNIIVDVVMNYDKEDRGLVIMSGILLGLFFGFLVVLVIMDMRVKHRTGELRDDMVGLKKMLVLALKAFPMLMVAIYTKLRSLRGKKEEDVSVADAAAVAQRTQHSRAIVERLAAKTSPSSLDTGCTDTVTVNSLNDVFVVGDE